MSPIQSVEPRRSGLVALIETSEGSVVEVTRTGTRLLVDGRDVQWVEPRHGQRRAG
jgi:hypothetical protein